MSILMMAPQERIMFDGKNWPIYKRKIRALLLQHDLLEAIDGGAVQQQLNQMKTDTKVNTQKSATSASSSSSSSPGDDQDEAEVGVQAKKKQNKAYSVLMLSLDDARTQMVLHIKEGDAAGVWRTLVSQYESSSMASKAHTRSMLHKTKMDPAVDLYKSRVVELKMRLEAMGETVSDGELVYVILEGLPAAYSALKQSLSVQDEFGFEKICGHIRDHQEKMKYRGVVEEEFVQELAAFSRSGQGAAGSGSYRQGGAGGRGPSVRFGDEDVDEWDRCRWPCRLCSKVGHAPWECAQRKGSGRFDCFKCGASDHRMRDCPEFRRGGRQQQAMLAVDDGEEFGW